MVLSPKKPELVKNTAVLDSLMKISDKLIKEGQEIIDEEHFYKDFQLPRAKLDKSVQYREKIWVENNFKSHSKEELALKNKAFLKSISFMPKNGTKLRYVNSQQRLVNLEPKPLLKNNSFKPDSKGYMLNYRVYHKSPMEYLSNDKRIPKP